jgi:hypothetical protein
MPQRRHIRDATGDRLRPALSRAGRRIQARVSQRRLAPSERQLAEWFQTLTNEQQDQWLRLVRVLSRAESRGDEFTWKRFDRLTGPGWELASVLAELERPVGRRMRAYR